jgi:hypothetical protein
MLRAVLRLTRPFLHAERLAFTHPRTGEYMEFTAPLPDDLRGVLEDVEPDLLRMLEGKYAGDAAEWESDDDGEESDA